MIAETEPEATEINRMRWQCRRGMLELDYLLLEFVENQYTGLSSARKADFRRLLEESDQDLQRWLISGQVPKDSAYADLIQWLFQGRSNVGRT
jgi:antitoxin CptB